MVCQRRAYVSTCMERACTCAWESPSIVGELLLSWQGWVLIGTPSEWYERRCHRENSTDRPTLIHSYGERLSPEGLQIIKAFTTLNNHTSHFLSECACVTYIRLYVCKDRMFCLYIARICQISSCRLHRSDDYPGETLACCYRNRRIELVDQWQQTH